MEARPTGGLEETKHDLAASSSLTPASVSLSRRDEGSKKHAVVIGLYGVPGSGKSFLLNRLKHELDPSEFNLHEGSAKIAALVPGGLEAFSGMPEHQRAHWRGRAIDEIGRGSASTSRTAVVSGHYMFWDEDEDCGTTVCTQNELETYTHIIYLQVDPKCIARRRVQDKLRARPAASPRHLSQWQQAEIQQLESRCRRHGILFAVVAEQAALLLRVSALIRRFRQDAADQDFLRAQNRLDQVLPDRGRLRTVLVLDGDRTLAAEDTGALFWQMRPEPRTSTKRLGTGPLKELFGGALGYSDCAFHQAALLYEEVAPDNRKYESLCANVASSTKVYPEFLSLLRSVAGRGDVGAVVATCGLGRVWEHVLEREGLSRSVKVVGGGRTTDGLVVTPATKAALVSRLRHVDGLHVVAFGDSPLDLPMLRAANEAVVVVGDEQTRSRSMEAALAAAVEDGLVGARQILLPDHVSPRLDERRLPRVSITSQEFVDSITNARGNSHDTGMAGPRIRHATDKGAAQLLMSATRDAALSGPRLRAAHQQVGRYLAIEYLSAALGLEEYPIPHVQGHQTSGHRLRDERQTSIVALMRGGEPLALGVSDVFPLAMFVHAESASSIRSHHVRDQKTVVLVDSVVNTGKTLLLFMEHIRHMCPSIRIVVVAGVVQAGAVAQGQALAVAMSKLNVQLVALRLSDNKFTGTRTTDTGNRLFNTTHLS